ncbi:MAG: metalloprotease family protein [Lachnospiraceae bacterium]
MILFILQYVHEIIHALLYPLKEKKEIYYMQGKAALFVYCQAKVSKLRFIIICMHQLLCWDSYHSGWGCYSEITYLQWE